MVLFLVVFAGSDDHTVRIWDCCSGQCLRIIQTHTVAELKFDQDHIFTASFDTTAACWDFHTGELCNRYSGHVAAVFSVDYSRQLDLVITGSADSTVKIWVLSSGQLIHTMPHHRSNWIMQVKRSPLSILQIWFILLKNLFISPNLSYFIAEVECDSV